MNVVEKADGLPISPMALALELARAAFGAGEVPVGAVITNSDGKVIGRGRNRVIELSDPSAHAEILAIREAGELLSSERLVDCDLYVTLEPCTMCAGAISLARIRRLYFGAQDPKGGGVDHGACFFDQTTCHHKPEVYGGIRESEASDLLRLFFASRRGSLTPLDGDC